MDGKVFIGKFQNENKMIEHLKTDAKKKGLGIVQFPQYSGVDIAYIKNEKVNAIAELKSKINLKYPLAMKKKGWIIEHNKIEKLQIMASILKCTAYLMLYAVPLNELYIWKITNANGDLNKEVSFNLETIDMPKGHKKKMQPTKVYRLQSGEAEITKL